jgi:UDP:flavonoid glycosyltransferase YjiC (YdhE family)
VRVLLAVEGTRGDVHPMLALAESLEAAGHTVSFCGPEDAGAEARARGIDFTSTGEDVHAFLQANAASLHTRGPKFFASVHEWGKHAIASQFRAVNDLAAETDFVLAAGTSFAASSVCELRGLPYRYVLFTPAMLPSALHSPALLPFQSNRPWVNRLLWWLLPRMSRFTVGALIETHRRALGLPPMRDPVRELLSPCPILATDDVLTPGPPDSPIPFEQMRCFHPHQPGALPAKLEAFVAAGAPPVYFGFGSMTDPDPGLTTRCLLNAIEALGVRAVISKGWAGLGGVALPEGVFVTDSVPHASLFPHCSVIVHHGGSGTTHTAARAGVPQVVVPHVLDQFYFERRLQLLGVAPPGVPRPRLTPQRLVDTVGAALDNELLAARARELGDRLSELGPTSPDASRVLALP